MKEVRDDDFMRLALAEGARGNTAPNPRVGAVVVKNGQVIGRGHHRRAGLPHAEVESLRNCSEDPKGATIYVTLEPCNHHGRTPPCTEAILEAGLSRVVVSYRDPAPHVPGALERLSAAGLDVRHGVLAPDGRALVCDFEKLIKTGLPYVTAKSAVTLDGKIATRNGDSKWITGAASRAEGHRLRSESEAVIVGVKTVIADDPSLTVRDYIPPPHFEPRDQPRPVVFDTKLRTPVACKVVQRGALIYAGQSADPDKRRALEKAGAEVVEIESGDRLDLRAALLDLGSRGAMRVLVEGGGVLQGAMLDAELVDAAAIFVAPLVLGDGGARSAFAGAEVTLMSAAHRIDGAFRTLDNDVFIEGPLVPRIKTPKGKSQEE